MLVERSEERCCAPGSIVRRCIAGVIKCTNITRIVLTTEQVWAQEGLVQVAQVALTHVRLQHTGLHNEQGTELSEHLESVVDNGNAKTATYIPVSYTHLTLPTKA